MTLKKIKLTLCLTISLSLFSFFNFRQSNNVDFITITEIRLDSSGFINFNLTNKLKSPIKFFTIKDERTDCRILQHTFKKHKPHNNSWGTATPWYGPQNYDSLSINSGKSCCFFLNIGTKDVDTIVAVSYFKHAKKNFNKKESLFLCFVIKNGLVSEFIPDFETKQMLYSMDGNRYRE